jgi:hypothetical protein
MRDYGKMMQPPADATHCGGYPVNPPAREEAEALLKDYRSLADYEKFGVLDRMADFIAREILGE